MSYVVPCPTVEVAGLLDAPHAAAQVEEHQAGCVRGCALRVFGGRGVRMGAILGVYVGAPCVCLGTAVSERARVGCLGEHHSWCERWDARVCLGERKRGVRSVTG